MVFLTTECCIHLVDPELMLAFLEQINFLFSSMKLLLKKDLFICSYAKGTIYKPALSLLRARRQLSCRLVAFSKLMYDLNSPG
jgi:hypothetical protein